MMKTKTQYEIAISEGEDALGNNIPASTYISDNDRPAVNWYFEGTYEGTDTYTTASGRSVTVRILSK